MIKQSIHDKIKQRRLQLLVHSCVYYRHDTNIISDSTWSKWAKELQELQSKNPEISSQVELYEYFKQWDGSSGAFLPIEEDWVNQIAIRLINVGDRNVGKSYLLREQSKLAKKEIKRKLF